MYAKQILKISATDYKKAFESTEKPFRIASIPMGAYTLESHRRRLMKPLLKKYDVPLTALTMLMGGAMMDSLAKGTHKWVLGTAAKEHIKQGSASDLYTDARIPKEQKQEVYKKAYKKMLPWYLGVGAGTGTLASMGIAEGAMRFSKKIPSVKKLVAILASGALGGTGAGYAYHKRLGK